MWDDGCDTYVVEHGSQKKTLAKIGTKIVPCKSSGHDRKRYSVVLCGFDNQQKAIPGIIFKNLKKVPAEVRDRKDCFVAVAPGGSMTPHVLKLWVRKVWAKRPTADMFRAPNILGWDMHYSHLDEEVTDTLKTVSNTTCKYTPGGMTCVMAGPDTHWNKSFKGYMHKQMDEYLDNEEYTYTNSGKISPAPYSLICDWVVKAWNEIPPEAISNAFIHNGWEQAFNGNDTKVLHGTLRDIVENNIVRGYQRRATPQQVEAHNLMVTQTRHELNYGDDFDSAGDFSDEDDFDFYRLQMQDDLQASTNRTHQQPFAETLPADYVNFSEEESSGDEGNGEEGSSEEGNSIEADETSSDSDNNDAGGNSTDSEIQFLG